jgi:triose/dihydroxyacetone kinase / FAD-AMP lyase (cyclizing)
MVGTPGDTLMGDGDCGETLKTGATSLLAALDGKGIAASGSVVTVLRELEDIVEGKMGGTLGGILGIFFVSLRNAVEHSVQGGPAREMAEIWGNSLATALGHLTRYTPAKVGDRTVMDTLLPFAAAIQKSGSLDEGVAAAVRGAEATRNMTPRLGRATYVAAARERDGGGGGGGGGGGVLPPDPGAWGAMVALQGLRNGLTRRNDSGLAV